MAERGEACTPSPPPTHPWLEPPSADNDKLTHYYPLEMSEMNLEGHPLRGSITCGESRKCRPNNPHLITELNFPWKSEPAAYWGHQSEGRQCWIFLMSSPGTEERPDINAFRHDLRSGRWAATLRMRVNPEGRPASMTPCIRHRGG